MITIVTTQPSTMSFIPHINTLYSSALFSNKVKHHHPILVFTKMSLYCVKRDTSTACSMVSPLLLWRIGNVMCSTLRLWKCVSSKTIQCSWPKALSSIAHIQSSTIPSVSLHCVTLIILHVHCTSRACFVLLVDWRHCCCCCWFMFSCYCECDISLLIVFQKCHCNTSTVMDAISSILHDSLPTSMSFIHTSVMRCWNHQLKVRSLQYWNTHHVTREPSVVAGRYGIITNTCWL